MNRRPSTYDLSWLLDLHFQNKQLDLDPPYQRRSVWTLKDRQFFLDTIFRNYPSPAIFLHKTIDEAGKSTYHVVDGKQRTQTILDFVNDRIRIAEGFLEEDRRIITTDEEALTSVGQLTHRRSEHHVQSCRSVAKSHSISRER